MSYFPASSKPAGEPMHLTMNRTPYLVPRLITFVAVALVSTLMAQERYPFGRLDEQSTTLSILRTEDGFSLHWNNVDTLHFWCVTFSTALDMSNLDTLSITSDTFYVHHDSEGLFDFGYFRVDPIDAPPPVLAPDTILSFANVPVLMSIPGEDIEPSGFTVDDTDSFDANGMSLQMHGNTWKRHIIQPHRVDSTDVWSVAAKLIQLGEVHAFGIADSANFLYYVFWGKEAPQSLNWITTYEGYFDSLEWVDFLLPVGEDWQGRFGYAPNITELRFVNDNDTVSIDGVVRYDEIRDVTNALPLVPHVEFSWTRLPDSEPDSFRIAFRSFIYDLDSPELRLNWDFGDGSRSAQINPEHSFRSNGRYPVTLSVSAQDGRCVWLTQAIVDSPVTESREAWFSFTGDVILGRGYENNNGIIESWGVDTIFAPTLQWTGEADLCCMNLECPFTTATVRHPTKGIVFKSRPENVAGLVNAGVDFVTLANNHVYDYLEAGMLETMAVLDSVGIVHNGSGMNDELARQVRFLSHDGISFAMLSFSDRTGSYNNVQPFLDAGRSRPGFAMWNRAAIDATVSEAAALSDYVIINTHSGSEYSLEPLLNGPSDIFDPLGDEDMLFELIPDTLERQIRQYAIDMGAELVIAHHPHIIQGFEVYNGKLIAHSLGNFVFDLNYAETMPSLVLRTHFDGADGVDQAIVHPVYINHWIPQPARGDLARNILDYESEMSRRLNTWLIRPAGADSAFVVFDTASVNRVSSDMIDTVELRQEGSWFTSAPFKLSADGYVQSVVVQNGAGWQVRFGRERLYSGNKEDEGASDWLLNSADETYDSTTFRSGARSIRLRRTFPNPQNVVCNNEYRLPISPFQTYSVCGWIRTQNANNALLQAQYWSGRSGGTAISIEDIGTGLNGTSDWVFRDAQLIVPANAYFVVIREVLNTPPSGTGYAWFDDIALVQWDAWSDAPASAAFPNDYHYVQVRNSVNHGTAIIEYTVDNIGIAELEAQIDLR